MFIPHDALEPSTLTALLEDYASRDGTDYGEQEISLQDKVNQLRNMLSNGKLVISYDPDTESCTLLPVHS